MWMDIAYQQILSLANYIYINYIYINHIYTIDKRLLNLKRCLVLFQPKVKDIIMNKVALVLASMLLAACASVPVTAH